MTVTYLLGQEKRFHLMRRSKFLTNQILILHPAGVIMIQLQSQTQEPRKIRPLVLHLRGYSELEEREG
jgi:hypothetical protein